MDSDKPKFLSGVKLLLALLALAFAVFIWASDRVTLEGERTVYTVTCNNGKWVQDRCDGSLSAGPKYRFRALKAHSEVLFWVSGSAEPSKKLVGCRIENGRNWICPPSADSAQSITLAMSMGAPVRNAEWNVIAFHRVPKLTWVLLDMGLYWG